MRNFQILLILLAMLVGCSPLSVTPESTLLPTQEPTSTSIQTSAPNMADGIELTDTQELVNKMDALCCDEGWWNHLFNAEYQSDDEKNNGEEYDIGAAFLENLEQAGEKFDVNEYFTILTHLALEDGYGLDYVYFSPGGDGFPNIYAKLEENPPFATHSEYEDAGFENYLSHIQVDGTPESYFELALLSIMGEQFYLAWHAEYNDREVVSSPYRLKEIIERLNEEYIPLTKEQQEDVLQLDVTPRVKFVGDKALVRVVVFTKWGGFYERIYTIDRNFPHKMVDEDVQLIPYMCGVVF